MTERLIDYEAVTSFISLLRGATWHQKGWTEYLRCNMHPDLEPYLPEHVVILERGDEPDDEGLIEVTLLRPVGAKI